MNSSSGLVRVPVEAQIAGDSKPLLPRQRGPDLAGLATFTLDRQGRVASWSLPAARMFGAAAAGVAGRDVCDVLLTGPGQRQLISEALAQVKAGRVWTATVAMAMAGGGPVAIRCEPLAGPGTGALVIVQPASSQPGQGLLGDAVDRIGTTLDLTQTAREAVDVAVPGFADAAAIYVPERLLAADELSSHREGHEMVVRRLVARLADQPPADTDSLLLPGEVLVFGPDSPCFRAMATGSPVVFGHFDGEATDRISRRPGGEEIVSRYTSFLAVPLPARGSVVGCATFGREAGSPPFGRTDIVLASQLAARAAVCIDNARLYGRERRTVLALQRGLLSGEPDVPAGLEVAHHYLPVGASVVGGDWHDIVPLPGGKAALIVGDAMGHGPEAAAVMVQLRTAAHTLADLELPPPEVLRRLDRMAAGMTAAPFATCICAVLDPSDNSCVLAKAGHLPPVLIQSDGTARVVDLPAGLPLGLGEESFQATRISLPPGATLALYTDGLVESRTRSLDDGTAAMCAALAAALTPPGSVLGSVCASVTEVLCQHGEDDITLVLARIRQ